MSASGPAPLDDDARDMARTDAFSDGVIAIAITLLAFQLRVPSFEQSAASNGLLRALLDQWPSYLAFFTSFLTIIIMWINHHRLFNLFRKADQTLMIFNGLLLMGITVVPFTTELIASYLRASNSQDVVVAAVIYSGWLLVIALFYQAIWRYASHERRLLRASVTDAQVRQINRQYRFGPPIYLAAVLIALFSPLLSLLATLGVALWFAIPPR
ncbi:MAG TPA: TMEM175 family protein [Candidatus Limnocylindrales bacterium]|nr:TMEM175 family protein [Candidatus Limnocylindrales bacterium]